MPKDTATVAIKIFAADVARVDESSIFDAGLLSSGNLGVRDSVVAAVVVVPVVLTVLVTATAASPLFISGPTTTGLVSTG